MRLFAAAACVAVCLIIPLRSEEKDGGGSKRRHVRETTHWVDILVLVDRAIYETWYNRTAASQSANQRQNEAQSNIRRYFTLVMKEASALYSAVGSGYRMDLRPVRFYMDTQGAKQWIVKSAPGLADADLTLASMGTWLTLNMNDSGYDHAILFTGENIATGGLEGTTGRGTTGTLCKGPGYDSKSVIEDKGSFLSAFTVAHEVGHSLNAVHDGDSNMCSGKDRYIMAADNSAPLLDGIQGNPWRFSTCSKAAINLFVNSLSQEQLGRCLGTQQPQTAVPDVSQVIPGQLYGINDQCQHQNGPQSSFCYRGSLSTICTALACSEAAGIASSCYTQFAATGTSCGDKKWCQLGQCVYSNDAPAIDSCVRDQVITVNNMPCSKMVQISPYFCYQPDVFPVCCNSCRTIDSGNKDCPYGDLKPGCSAEFCHKILPDGSIVDETCCSNCSFRRSSWRCEDSAQIDGLTCQQAVRQNGVQGCYNFTLAFHCCRTCQQLRQKYGTKDCEYGDRQLQGCPLADYPKLCCATGYSSSRAARGSHCSLPLLLSQLLLSLMPPALVKTLWAVV